MVSGFAGMFKRRKMPAECAEVRDVSSDYIDGDLDASTAERVTSHVERCPPCKAFLNTLRATVNMLRGMPPNDPPDDFRRRVRDSVRKSSQR